MPAMPIDEVQAKLPELIHTLFPLRRALDDHRARHPGGPIGIDAAATGSSKIRWDAGSVTYMAADFDSPLEEFREVYAMKLLLDSHTLIWAVDDLSRLDRRPPKSWQILRTTCC